ncbi:unnamed protein product, partial [Strongylus vulgaris]
MYTLKGAQKTLAQLANLSLHQIEVQTVCGRFRISCVRSQIEQPYNLRKILVVGSPHKKDILLVDKNHFCDGDYCFVQKQNGKFTKGCVSLNERNSWSHLKSGHRHIMGVDQWLCQHHLCNFDLSRVARALAPTHKLLRRLNGVSEYCLYVV